MAGQTEQVVQELTLDFSGFDAGLGKAVEGWDELDRRSKQFSQQNPFRKQADDLLKFNTQLRNGGQVFLQNIQGPKQLEAELKRLAAEYVKTASAQKKASNPDDFKKTQEDVKKLRAEIDALTKQIDKANQQIDKLNKKRNSGGSGKDGGILSKIDIGGTVGQLASGAGLALGGAEVIRRAVTDSAEYSRKLSELSALTGAVGKDLAFLDKQAQALESDTGIVASTILDTFKAVGSIQPQLLSNKQALADTTKEVVALAQAGSITLPEAAQATLGALNQFGESADQASRFVNVLAAGALKGASEINDTTQALQDSGTAMKAAGLSFEEGNALIQSLAGVMIKGSEAGTGLRNVLLKLETDTDKNLRPSVVGLEKALENASKKYDTTTELTKTFGVENILVARRILDTRTEIAGLTKELTGTDVAYQQQRTNLNNLATDLDKAGSATTGFFRTLGQSQDGLLRRLVQGYTLFVQNLSNAKSVARTFLDSYINNDSDGLIGALYTAGKEASRQSDANEVIRKRNAEIAGITKAAQQQVAGETKDLVELYNKQGVELPEAQRKAAEYIKKQSDQALIDARANHEKIKREYEKATVDEQSQFNARFEQSRKNILSAQTAKNKADSEVARLNKQDADRAKTLKSLQGEGPSDEEKKAERAAQAAAKQAEERATKLIDERRKLEEELKKVQDDYDKQRLDSLDKDSAEYLELKKKIDLKEVEQLRDHLIKMGQFATGHDEFNVKTGAYKRVDNKDYKLPQSTEELIQRRKEEIESASQVSEFEAQEAKARATFERQQFLEKSTRTREESETQLSLRKALLDKESELAREAGESEQQYEQRKARALLKIRLEYYEKLLALAKQDPLAASDPAVKEKIQGLEEAIADTKKGISDIAKQDTSGSKNLLDILGISITDKDGNNVTDQASKLIEEAGAKVINASNEILQNQINNDQARIDSIDRQLDAKKQEVEIELELQRQGLANNLAVKRQEQAALQAERQKAVEAQRRDQAIQLSINATLQASELALAAARIFKGYAGLPVLGQIAAIAEIASMFIAFGATVTKIATLPKYHDGDEVTAETAHKRSMSGSPGPDEVDARLQIGEGVIRKKSYQANKRLLKFLNTVDSPVRLDDLAAYVNNNPFGMLEESQKYGLDQINLHYQIKAEANQPDRVMHQKQDQVIEVLGKVNETLERNARVKSQPLGDGKFREEDENGNVRIVKYTN